MMVYLYAYLATLAVFLPCDMVWLGTMASRLYKPTLGNVLLSDANLPAAGAFYAIYPVGLVFFAVVPALKSRQPGSGDAERRAVRLLHLHDLRSHQPGNAEELDHPAYSGRYRLGHAARRNLGDYCLLDHVEAHRLTLQPDQRLQQTADHAVQLQIALHRHQADAILRGVDHHVVVIGAIAEIEIARSKVPAVMSKAS